MATMADLNLANLGRPLFMATITAGGASPFYNRRAGTMVGTLDDGSLAVTETFILTEIRATASEIICFHSSSLLANTLFQDNDWDPLALYPLAMGVIVTDDGQGIAYTDRAGGSFFRFDYASTDDGDIISAIADGVQLGFAVVDGLPARELTKPQTTMLWPNLPPGVFPAPQHVEHASDFFGSGYSGKAFQVTADNRLSGNFRAARITIGNGDGRLKFAPGSNPFPDTIQTPVIIPGRSSKVFMLPPGMRVFVARDGSSDVSGSLELWNAEP